jgi:hypothetical protein
MIYLFQGIFREESYAYIYAGKDKRRIGRRQND